MKRAWLGVLLVACGGATQQTDSPQPEATSTEASAHQGQARALGAGATSNKPTGEPDLLPAPPDVAAVPDDATVTESGLATRVLAPGSGVEHPSANANVTVHYTGWMPTGERFDSSVERGVPATFPLQAVIAGWTEGVQLMVVGERRRLWIPGGLAYGEAPPGYKFDSGRPLGMLVFDVELLEIEEPPPPPETPTDLKNPKRTKKTKSGLRHRVLQKGTGTVHPTAESRVTVHYSGWLTSGELFDSSITRDNPVTFPLSAVIPGWTEGVQLMVAGEKRRFWIPADLAYGEAPKDYKYDGGRPLGTIVFDVELIAIE